MEVDLDLLDAVIDLRLILDQRRGRRPPAVEHGSRGSSGDERGAWQSRTSSHQRESSYPPQGRPCGRRLRRPSSRRQPLAWPGAGLRSALRCAQHRTALRRHAVRRRHARRCTIVNRTQALVLGFFVTALASLVVIRAAASNVYDQALRLPPSWPRWVGIAFLIALAAFLALLAVGVLRRWRWTFWLILVAFLAGVLRVPVAILQLAGVLPANVPSWYVVFQGLIGLAQLTIGLVMLAGYRRSGVWGTV